MASASSRAYLRRIDQEQRAAVARLHRAIPEARVGRRFRVLLDGLTVTLPAKRLPRLVRVAGVTRSTRSLRYTLATDPSPSVIGADALQAATGATGAGIKIGVVDDGIDQTNPYLSPAGFSYPAGFPKGNTAFTTPKVIVAKSFPGPNSGAVGALPVDRAASFHGTHVSGIAAGDAGTSAPAGRDHPAVSGLTGVAPRAWLGNYRVFTVPTPVGHVANTPEIVAAFEAAVSDGMNVINFSGGGPQTDPANDPMIETIRNTVAAGVTPVIAAGNDRDDFGAGTVGSPGVSPDAITVAAVSNSVVYAPTLSVQNADAPASLQAIPFESNDAPASWATVDQTLVDVTSVTGTDGKPVEAHLCGPAGNPNGTATTLPAGSLTGKIVLASRGACAFVVKAAHAQSAGAIGIVLVDNRSGEANPIPAQLPIPSGMIADLDGAQLRAYLGTHGGQATIRAGGDFQQIPTGRGGVITSFSSAGPTEWGHMLKPDVSAPGGQILSSTLPEFAGSPFAVFDGTSMATPHIAGAAALLLQLHPGWAPGQVKSALMSTAAPAWGDTARTVEAPVFEEGGGIAQLTGATDPRLFTSPASLSYPDLDVNAGAKSLGQLVRLTDAGGGAGVWQVTLRPQSASAGTTIDVPGQISVPPGGGADLSVVANASAGAAAGDDYGFVVLTQGAVSRRIPYGFSVTRPGLAGARVIPLQKFQVGSTAGTGSRVSAYRYPSAPFGPGPNYTDAPMNEDGAEQLYSILIQNPVANFGVSVVGATSGSGDRPVHARVARRERRAGLRRNAGGRERPDATTTRSTSARPPRCSRASRRSTSRSTRAATRSRASCSPASTSCAPGSNDVTPPTRAAADDDASRPDARRSSSVRSTPARASTRSRSRSATRTPPSARLHTTRSPGSRCSRCRPRRRSSRRERPADRRVRRTSRRRRTSTRSATTSCRTRPSSASRIKVVSGPAVSWLAPARVRQRRRALLVAASSTAQDPLGRLLRRHQEDRDQGQGNRRPLRRGLAREGPHEGQAHPAAPC